MKKQNIIISKRLSNLRKEANLTQAELANKIDLARQTYGYYENGNSVIPHDVLINLSKFYKVSIDYICGIRETKSTHLADVGNKLKLSDKSINNILENGENKNWVGNFALNQLLENMDFQKIGKYLVVPSLKNKHIPKNEMKVLIEKSKNPFIPNNFSLSQESQDMSFGVLFNYLIRLFNTIKEDKITTEKYIELMKSYEVIEFEQQKSIQNSQEE